MDASFTSVPRGKGASPSRTGPLGSARTRSLRYFGATKVLSLVNLATWLGLDVTFPREDDDQDPASAILSTDVGEKTSLSLGKTTTRAQHPRYCRRMLERKRHFTYGRRRPGSSILDTVGGYWKESVTLPREDEDQGPREDDDQGPASSTPSTDIGKKTSLYLGKTMTSVQHPRNYRRILGRKRPFT